LIGLQFDDPNQPCEAVGCLKGLDTLFRALIAFVVSFPVGAAAGCWSVLTIRRHSGALTTAGITSGLIAMIEFVAWIAVPIAMLATPGYEMKERLYVPIFVVALGLPLISLMVVPVFARLLVRFVIQPNTSWGPALPPSSNLIGSVQ
jgi:hypothetical protein